MIIIFNFKHFINNLKNSAIFYKKKKFKLNYKRLVELTSQDKPYSFKILKLFYY